MQSGAEMELMESQPLLEWLADNYKTFGAKLEIITDKSQEGSQFVRGFGGIGGNIFVKIVFANRLLILFSRNLGILRYKVDIQSLQGDGAFDDEDYDLSDY
jgi:peptide chain release factor subunit 1